jgi:hypothetical protein
MKIANIAPLAALSIALAGCDAINPWAQKPGTVTPSQSQTQTPLAAHTKTAVPSAKTSASRSPAQTVAPASAEPGKQVTPAATTVTFADEDAQRSHTEKILNDSDLRLSKIDRSKLSAGDASVYQQAQELSVAARQALENRDYLLASGLAEKASLLANTIAPKAR